MDAQLTTIVLLRYEGFKNKFWGLSMMQFAHRQLSQVPGIEFYKLFGSGKANFNPFPDWGVYSILITWSSSKAASAFFSSHPLVKKYRNRTIELCVLYMQCLKSKGPWNGINPFLSASNPNDTTASLAVITRASIKKSHVFKFWKQSAATQKTDAAPKGLVYSKGFGELPFVEMATFSIWNNLKDMQAFAYASRGHTDAIKNTRVYNWYSEELFSRFKILKIEGVWSGLNGFNII